jgi:RHS repeat-associated protein
VVEFSYDLRGQITQQRCGDVVEQFTYDEAGRLVAAANEDIRLAFEYDELGNLLVEQAGERITRNAFDAAGRRVGRTTPSGHLTQWAFDEIGAPTLMSTPAGGLAFEHDAAGRETARHLSPYTSIVRSWDPSHRLTGAVVWHRPESGEYGVVQAHGYRYRGDGMPVAHTDALRGDRSFELDPLGRITAATSPNRGERYSYDAAGNIASRTVGGDDDADGPREYQGLRVIRAGRIHYSYDEDGRLISAVRRTLSGGQRVWRYTWDGFDRLVGVQTPDGARWRYRYDPLGRRIAKQQLADDGTVLSEVLFAWDGTRLAEQITVTADGPVEIYSWDYLPGTDEVAAQSVATETDRRFYAIVTDLVGTPTELLTDGGQVAWQSAHDVWGNPWGGPPSQVQCPLRFPGQYHDPETGLHYNLSRYYDPTSGHYATPDPLGLEPSPHHRAYVPNPLVWIDPLGLAKCLKVTDDTMKHVRGEINRGGRPVGYHHRPGGRDRFGWRTTGKSGIDENGCYTGTVTGKVWENNTWVEKRHSSSFFPDHWSEDQVRHAITRAADNGSIVEGTNMWRGTYRGISMEGYFDPATKNVITGYPIFKGALS